MLRTECLKKNYIRFIVWAMFGMITSMIISCMLLVGSINIDKFYDVGECYDYYSSYIRSSGQNVLYDYTTHVFTITAENPCNTVILKTEPKAWKYMYFTVTETGKKENINAQINFYSETGEMIASQNISLYMGENELLVPEDISFNKMIITYDMEVGDIYGIDNIEFMERKKPFTMSLFGKISTLMFLAYVILSGIISAVVKVYHIHFQVDWYAPIELLQKLFCIVGNQCGKYVLHIEEKKRKNIRTLLFVGLFLYMQVAKNLGWYHTKSTYNYQLVVAAVFIVLIALLCYEKKTQLCNWKNPLAGAWFALWTMACISDFLVPKRYAWVGYIMIFAMGFLFFMWNNMKDKMRLVKNLVDAVLLVYVVDIVFCFFCRPEKDGIRYAGVYFNSITFGADLAIVCIIWIYIIDCKLEKEKKIYQFIPTLIWGNIAVSFLWKTQSASGLYVLPICIAIFLLQQIKARRKPIKILMLAGMCVVLFIPTYLGTDWCLHNLSYRCNTVIQFEKDYAMEKEKYKSIFTQTVYASETGIESTIGKNHAIDKMFEGSLTEVLSGRDYFWKAYFRETNLFGHESKGLTLWGQISAKPHSGFLMILYRYGVYVMIPYMMMIGINLIKTWKSFNKGERGGLLIVLITVSVCMRLLIENVEYAFLGLDWFLLYLLMGKQFMGNMAEEYDEKIIDKKIK